MSNFLDDYAILSSNNQSPTEYHVWCALSALSHAVSKKVWTDQGIFKVHANMYVFLVGTAGIAKTMAMRIAQNLIGDIENIPCAGDAVTKEALLRNLASDKSPSKKVYNLNGTAVKYTHLSIFANEFTTLIKAGGNEAGYIDMLVNIWDQKVYNATTISRGEDKIINPYITLLGCITTPTLQNLIDNDLITSGMARRAIFVHADKNGAPVPRPLLTEAQKEAWERCTKRLTELSEPTVAGQFVWSEDMIPAFDKWYTENFYEAENGNMAPALNQFKRTKPEYVLKLCMLLQLAESNDLILTLDNMYKAIGLLDLIEPSVQFLFGGAGKNKSALLTNEILAFIEAFGRPVPLKRIYARYLNDASVDDIDSMLDGLSKADKIQLKLLVISGTNVKVAMSNNVAQTYQDTKQ